MLVAVVGVSVWSESSQPYAVETAPGEQRAVQLADGSEIVLAGGSRVTLDRADARVAGTEGERPMQLVFEQLVNLPTRQHELY